MWGLCFGIDGHGQLLHHGLENLHNILLEICVGLNDPFFSLSILLMVEGS